VRGEYRMVSVEGVGATNVVTHTAPDATGPWSKPRQLIRPPEAEQRRAGAPKTRRGVKPA